MRITVSNENIVRNPFIIHIILRLKKCICLRAKHSERSRSIENPLRIGLSPIIVWAVVLWELSTTRSPSSKQFFREYLRESTDTSHTLHIQIHASLDFNCFFWLCNRFSLTDIYYYYFIAYKDNELSLVIIVQLKNYIITNQSNMDINQSDNKYYGDRY